MGAANMFLGADITFRDITLIAQMESQKMYRTLQAGCGTFLTSVKDPRIATRVYLFISTIDVGGSCWLRRSVSATTARANWRKALPTGLSA